MPGDIVQLGDGSGHFYHTPVVLSVGNEILVAAHTFDALYRPLKLYMEKYAISTYKAQESGYNLVCPTLLSKPPQGLSLRQCVRDQHPAW